MHIVIPRCICNSKSGYKPGFIYKPVVQNWCKSQKKCHEFINFVGRGGGGGCPATKPLAFHNPSPYSRAFVREFYFSRGQSAWGLLEFDTQRRASVSFEAPYYDSSIFTGPIHLNIITVSLQLLPIHTPRYQVLLYNSVP